ncbi:MAG: hypothetical protein AABW59_02860 [archaeon]
MPKKSMIDIGLVKDLIDTVGGAEAVALIKICETKRKSFTDEDVSKKMKKKVTEVRAILNRLHYRGIATYQKTRNQKTGWYNYTWDIKKERISEIIQDQQKENLEKLMEKKNLEADYNFFDCAKCNERMPFEIVAEYNFVCPGCGGQMDLSNDPKRQKELGIKIKNIEKEVKMVQEMCK